jgi:hypothetical protein
MNKRLVVCIAGLWLVVGAYAAEKTICTTDSLAETLLDQRIQSLQKMLDRNEKQALNWWRTWIGIYGTATAGQSVVAVFSEEKANRQDMILGAGTTLFGVVGQFITPVKTDVASEKNWSSALNHWSKVRKMQEMEKQLQKQAAIAVNGKGWQMQALAGSVNLTSGLITWLGFKRSVWDGVANFALNTAVTEVQIWTQPMQAKKDYQNYAMKYGLAECPRPVKKTMEWYAQTFPGGLKMGVNF